MQDFCPHRNICCLSGAHNRWGTPLPQPRCAPCLNRANLVELRLIMHPWLQDATAYITGGSSGIGLAIAHELRRHGASLVLIARNRQRLDEAQRELLTTTAPVSRRAPDSRQPMVDIVVADVTDSRQLQQTLREAVARISPPDILVNCAGMAHPGYFEQLDLHVLHQTMQVNLYGAWSATQTLLPYLRQRGGRIVNVASLAGLIGSFGYSAYAASKFALVGFSEALRNELKPDGVSVSLLCPSDTDTPQLHQENRIKPHETAALSGNGPTLQAGQVARDFLRGLRRRRFLIIAGRSARMVYLIKRLAPSILYRLMDGVVAKSRRRAQTHTALIGEQ